MVFGRVITHGLVLEDTRELLEVDFPVKAHLEQLVEHCLLREAANCDKQSESQRRLCVAVLESTLEQAARSLRIKVSAPPVIASQLALAHLLSWDHSNPSLAMCLKLRRPYSPW